LADTWIGKVGLSAANFQKEPFEVLRTSSKVHSGIFDLVTPTSVLRRVRQQRDAQSGRYHTFTNCVLSKLCDRVQAEFPHDVAVVHVHCAAGDVQFVADLLGRLTLGQKSEHLALADSKHFAMTSFAHRLGHRVGSFSAEVTLTLRDGADCCQHFGSAAGFHDVPASASREHLNDRVSVAIARKRQHFYSGVFSNEAARRSYAVNVWHIDIHDGHIRCEFPRQAHCVSAVARIGHNLDVGLALEYIAERLTQDRVILCQQEPSLHHKISSSATAGPLCFKLGSVAPTRCDEWLLVNAEREYGNNATASLAYAMVCKRDAAQMRLLASEVNS
jgi:hypothetical protein